MLRRFAALLMSIPLVASGAAGVALHVCQSMGGIAVGDCDCEREARHGNHGEHAHHEAPVQLKAQPCCEVELSSADALVAAREASSLRVDDAAIALVGVASVELPTSRLACDPGISRERAPPNIHGPPIFVRNCSFLN